MIYSAGHKNNEKTDYEVEFSWSQGKMSLGTTHGNVQEEVGQGLGDFHL